MKDINETSEKLKRFSCTKSIRDDLKKRGDLIYSDEPSRVIHEMGNMELFALGQISKTMQCHSCLKHLPPRFRFCGCGVCLRPDEDATNGVRARFQALMVPYCLARVNRSRGKKHGNSQGQKDHWKAIDARYGARKHDNHPSILSRWQTDEQHRYSQLTMGWTESYWRCLDYLTTIDISNHAPYHQRNRNENTITMKCNDSTLQSGPMRIREDYQETTKALLSLREEQGGTNTFLTKSKTTRQKNAMEPELQRKLEWLSENWEPTSSSSSSWSQSWWEDTFWQDGRWEDHQWHDHQWRDQKW